MKTKERIKSILIVVLLCGAAYLTYATWYFDSPISNASLWQIIVNPNAYQIRLTLGDQPVNGNNTGAARPLAAAIKTNAGRFGVPYGTDIINAVYDKTSLIMSEALGSASEFKTASQEEWQTALVKNGIFYDYRGTVFVDSLSTWMNTGRDTKFNETARYMFLCIDEEADKVLLYFKDPINNRIIRFKTALNVNDALSPLSGIYGNDCMFALELPGDYNLISPETIIVPDIQSPPAVTGYNPVMQFTEDKLQNILKTFGINSYTVSRYPEQDGTQVFIEDILTLRIAQNGIITFTDSRSSEETQLGVMVQSAYNLPTDIEYIEAALKLSQGLFTLKPGVGSIYLMDFRRLLENDDYAVLLGLSIDGIPVDMPETVFFARVIFRGKKVYSAVFNMRYYETSADTAKVLPEKLAIAAMLGNKQRGDLNLRYSDKGEYPLFPSWHVRLGNTNQE